MYDSIEIKIRHLIEDTLNSLNLNIVQIKYFGTQSKTLQILIERKDLEKISVSDCRQASNHISAILDVEDVITDKYHLEVSSPGIERPLITREDFVRFQGNHIVVRTKQAQNNRKTFRGRLLGMNEDMVELTDQETKEKVAINFDDIKSSNIILTDELYKQILNKAKFEG